MESLLAEAQGKSQLAEMGQGNIPTSLDEPKVMSYNSGNDISQVEEDTAEASINTDPDIQEPTPDEVQSEEPEAIEPQKFQVKANGQVYEFTQDELLQLAPKALNYTKKMQKIAPFRRSVSAMQENGITEDDINQLIEMKKGSKEAISNFISKNNISPYDIADIDGLNYESKKYGKEYTPLAEIDDELSDRPGYQELSNFVRTLDAASLQQLKANPDALRILIDDIEKGYYDKIMPEVNKRVLLGNNYKPVLDHYIEVATEQLNKAEQQAKAKEAEAKKQQRDEVRSKIKVTGKNSYQHQPKARNSYKDFSDDEIEEFAREMGLR